MRVHAQSGSAESNSAADANWVQDSGTTSITAYNNIISFVPQVVPLQILCILISFSLYQNAALFYICARNSRSMRGPSYTTRKTIN
jgi:hypothetical protein